MTSLKNLLNSRFRIIYLTFLDALVGTWIDFMTLGLPTIMGFTWRGYFTSISPLILRTSKSYSPIWMIFSLGGKDLNILAVFEYLTVFYNNISFAYSDNRHNHCSCHWTTYNGSIFCSNIGNSNLLKTISRKMSGGAIIQVCLDEDILLRLSAV